MKNKVWKYYGIAAVVLLLDQAFKIWVHFNMEMGEEGQIKLLGNWVKLFYTLNPGMAFGIQLDFKYGKLLLTLIRMVATVFIIYHINSLAKRKKVPTLPLWGWSLILGGATGNGIDSIFYGKWFQNATSHAPIPWFYGQVIDMLYLDIWTGKLPDWVPFVSKYVFSVFPIFNIADVAILAGVGLLFLTKEGREINP